MRLFTAVYPSEAALTSLDLALGGVIPQRLAARATGDPERLGGTAVADPGPGLRWVPREQRHLTLAFHGNVPDGALDDYVAELNASLAELPEFDLALGGGGTFGGRTLWVGVGTGVSSMRKLSEATNAAAEDAGIRGDRRAGSRPHLTLARASASRGEWGGRSRRRGHPNNDRRGRGGIDSAGPHDAPPSLSHLARALSVYQGPVWSVAEVCVVGSRLGAGPSGGPLHEVIARVPLGV